MSVRALIKSFRFRLAALIGSLLLAVLAAYTAYTAFEQTAFVEDLIRNQATVVARLIADDLAARDGRAQITERSSALIAQLNRHARSSGLLSVELVRPNGSVRARLLGADDGVSGDGRRSVPSVPAPTTLSHDAHVSAWIPLAPGFVSSEWLRVEMDNVPAREARAHLVEDSALVGVLLLLLGAGCALLALSKPMRSLSQIADFAERLGDAEDGLRIDDRSAELVRLERVLNDTARRLKHDRESLAKSERRFRWMLDNLRELAFEVDADFHVEYLNPAWQRFISRGIEQMIGQPLASLLCSSAAEVEQLIDALQDLADRGNADEALEIRIEDERGSPQWFNVRIRPRIEDGLLLGYSGSAADITAHKQNELGLVEGKEMAEEANRTKSSFLANMSHELRTPMNAIIGMTDLALESGLNEEQAEFMRQVRTSAERLLAIINEILDFSKIESGRLDFEQFPFGLRDCVEQSFATLRADAVDRNLLLEYRIDPTVPDNLEGDPHRLRQVLHNLVDNAIKFTESGHVVARVTAEQVDDSECTLCFAIEDTGIGIAPEQRERIFEAFTQADESATRRFGGTGLGLAIASRLVDRMGGRLELDSEPGVGSTFTFTVRLPRQPESIDDSDEFALDSLRLMVAGESGYETSHLTDALAEWQLRPEVEHMGIRVLARLRQSSSNGSPFHAVVLSDRLKDMDAFELARNLRRDPTIHQPVVVLAASSGQRGDAAQCRQIGVNAYLTRPFKSLDLLDAVMLALGNRRAENLITRHSLREKRRSLQILVATHDSGKDVVAPLEALGHVVHWVGNGVEAVESCHAAHFDLIIIDALLGSPDAVTVLVRLRASDSATAVDLPIIALVPSGHTEMAMSLESAGATQTLDLPLNVAALVGVIGKYSQGALPREETAVRQSSTGGSTLKVFDEGKALQYLDHDEDLLDQLIHVYLDSDLSLRMRLREAAALGDLHAAHSAVHAIGGSVGSFMAEATLSAVSRVEKRCRAGNAKGMEDDLKALWSEMDTLAAALGKRLHEKSTSGSAAHQA